MNLLRLIAPTATLTIALLLYTGCYTKQDRYLYLSPIVGLSRITSDIGLEKELSEKEYIAYDSLNIKVNILTKSINIASILPSSNAAYALTIQPPTLTPVEKINKINVRPTNYYDSAHLAYSDITAFCTFIILGDTTDMQGAINYLNNPPDLHGEHIPAFTIKLKQPPALLVEQHFIIELLTDNNSKLADTSQLITLY